MPATIQVGTGCVDITPPVGVDLCGFAGRASANVGVHDPLFAKAVVLDDGQTAWAILTSDLIGVSSEIVGAVREQAQEQAGIPAAHVMVTASHTHSGPHTSVLRGMGEADGHYVEVLTRKLAGVVQLAANARRKAAVGWRRGAVQLGVNRRERTAEGAVRLGSNPVGPVAAYVDVLSAFDDDGRPRAVLFSHAAHPVVLRADNLLVSADYPGYAQSLVARAWPTGPTALFAQGCCGNINVGPRGSFDDARQAGEVLGAEVVKCVQNTMPVERARLGAATRTVELPLADPPPREEAEEQVRRLRAELDGAISRGENRGQILWKKGLVAWAEDLLALSARRATGLRQPFEVQAFRVGDAAIIGLAGEVFVEYQLAIDEASPFEQQFVFGYANGCIGYVPTAAAFEEGGYEVHDAIRYYGRTMLTPECERIVMDAAEHVLGTLQSSG